MKLKCSNTLGQLQQLVAQHSATMGPINIAAATKALSKLPDVAAATAEGSTNLLQHSTGIRRAARILLNCLLQLLKRQLPVCLPRALANTLHAAVDLDPGNANLAALAPELVQAFLIRLNEACALEVAMLLWGLSRLQQRNGKMQLIQLKQGQQLLEKFCLLQQEADEHQLLGRTVRAVVTLGASVPKEQLQKLLNMFMARASEASGTDLALLAKVLADWRCYEFNTGEQLLQLLECFRKKLPRASAHEVAVMLTAIATFTKQQQSWLGQQQHHVFTTRFVLPVQELIRTFLTNIGSAGPVNIVHVLWVVATLNGHVMIPDGHIEQLVKGVVTRMPLARGLADKAVAAAANLKQGMHGCLAMEQLLASFISHVQSSPHHNHSMQLGQASTQNTAMAQDSPRVAAAAIDAVRNAAWGHAAVCRDQLPPHPSSSRIQSNQSPCSFQWNWAPAEGTEGDAAATAAGAALKACSNASKGDIGGEANAKILKQVRHCSPVTPIRFEPQLSRMLDSPT
jgi:hypothetical protein